MKTAIIPQIKDIEIKDVPLSLSDFYLGDSILRMFPRAPEIFPERAMDGKNPILYTVSTLSSEEYRIIARTGKIEICAADEKGLMYGLFTLSELDRLNDGELQEFDAFDKPSLAVRAVSDDISRGQISTMENFFSIIRRMARYKYNTYMPYLEDVFRYESIPAWGKYSDPIGKDEWRVLISYAKTWNISVRPIVNLLAHFDKSSVIRELQPLALRYRDGRISPVLDPRKPEVRSLIQKMLKELVDCFGPGMIHCGGDEPEALTQICGKTEASRLFIDHYTFISKELSKLNCRMMMYADFFAPPWGDYSVPAYRAKELPPDTEFVFWDYAVRDGYPMLEALHRQDLNLTISPGSWTWKRFSCDIRQCYRNTKGLLKADGGRSRGMILSLWADGGDTLRELNWPGILIGANFSWSPASEYEYEDCFRLIHQSLYGFSEEQAGLLEPIYHHDRILRRSDEFEFHEEMFRSPFQPVAFKDWENIGILQAAMRKAKADLASLEPKRNPESFLALKLTVARAAFTADKIAALPKATLSNQEDALSYSEPALALAGELPALKELHRKLWFDCNRVSEWETCACRYDDLYDQLRMFARDCRCRKIFEPLA